MESKYPVKLFEEEKKSNTAIKHLSSGKSYLLIESNRILLEIVSIHRNDLNGVSFEFVFCANQIKSKFEPLEMTITISQVYSSIYTC